MHFLNITMHIKNSLYQFAVSQLRALLLFFSNFDWSKISNSNLRNLVINGIFEEFNFREDSMMGALRKWSTSAINLILRSPPPSTLRAATWPRQASLPLYEWNRGESTWTYTCALCTHRHRRREREGGRGMGAMFSGRTNAKSMPGLAREVWRIKWITFSTFQPRRNQENFPTNGKKLINYHSPMVATTRTALWTDIDVSEYC